ncbi:hypothetical protein [Pontibacter arcticus]|uniref:Uncharacterized protein n=1 Tax=Pontibacter arcticus TaxID=2080288 RepID=A0A364RH42_9BACT|nr:hypothetical protein [Pontibacter arcticus]RAU83587.1 hypothetical protein DP923_00465 [Pontibacter arcticus]
MANKDTSKVKKGDGDTLGEKNIENRITKNPAPKEDTRESETTPPANEIYVNLEPDDLDLSDEDITEVGDNDEK